jgi:signal transduction histidine kinase
MKWYLCTTLLLSGSMLACAKIDSIEHLEQRLKDTDKELKKLSSYSFRGGTGAVGYRSDFHNSPNHTEWVNISLPESHTIDQVVLAPVLWRDSAIGLQADGFPEHFEIRVGEKGDNQGVVIAQFKAKPMDLPRIAPLIIAFKPIEASWMKIVVTKLSPRVWDGKFSLHLSEIMIFSGEENIALHQAITTSKQEERLGKAWNKDHLVDGLVPYVMDSAEGKQSKAYVSDLGIGNQASLTIDLKKVTPINRIHIHSPELSDTIPQSNVDGFGIPGSFILEGSTNADFSDCIELASYKMESRYNTGPVLMFRFPESSCRYLRLTAKQLSIGNRGELEGTVLGIAEIEVFSKAENVALGKTITTSYTEGNPHHSLSQITDGNNFFGEILSTRSWMEELAKRHQLENARPIIDTRLHDLYQDQQQQLRIFERIAVILAATIFITFLIYRNLRQRAIYQTRNRIAADLHDGLGANLHAIGLLGDLAKNEISLANKKNELTELADIVNEIREVSQDTGNAARSCTNILEEPELYSDLIGEMKRTSQSFLSDLDHTFEVQGEHYIKGIRKSTRVEIFLFYKECLANIIKHSRASKVTTYIRGDKKNIELLVTDNGQGMKSSTKDPVPPSLNRRTHLFGGKLDVTYPSSGGMTITLIYKRRRFKIRK